MALPTEPEIEELHRQYAPTAEAFVLNYTHCQIVRDVAEQLMASMAAIDKDLVRAGALLHDIGVYKLYQTGGGIDTDNYLRHGILGEELLRKEGFIEAICRFTSHHTGVGITREEIEKNSLPLPNQDYIAESKEERLVMYADKFHSKSQPPHFVSLEAYRQKIAQFGSEKVAIFNELIEEFGEPEIHSLAQKYGHTIA